MVSSWLATRYRRAPAIGAVAGLLVLGAPSVIEVPTGLAPTTTGIAAGLLLGFAASAVRSDRSAAVAALLGALTAYPIRREHDARFGSPRDWSVNLGTGSANTLVPVVAIALVLVLVVASVVTTSRRAETMLPRKTGPVAVSVPATAALTWAVYVSFGDSASSAVQWVAAVVVSVLVMVAVAARSGNDGGFVCAGLAVAATTVNGMAWSGWWVAPFAVAGIATGFVLARRVPATAVGCCVLAAVCASGFAWDTIASTIAYAVILPAAAAYSYASSLPSEPSVLALGILLPIVCAMFGFSALGKRPIGEYTWEPGELPAPGSVIPAQATAIVTAVVTSLVAALVATRIHDRNARRS